MVDWLDVGFNIVIIVVVAGIVLWWVFKIWNQVKKKKDEGSDEELDNLLKIQKLMKKK